MGNAISSKQRTILDHLRTNETVSTEQAVTLIGGNIYANKAKWVGATLGRMVRRGLIVRIKPGLFRMPTVSDHTGNDLFSF